MLFLSTMIFYLCERNAIHQMIGIFDLYVSWWALYIHIETIKNGWKLLSNSCVCFWSDKVWEVFLLTDKFIFRFYVFNIWCYFQSSFKFLNIFLIYFVNYKEIILEVYITSIIWNKQFGNVQYFGICIENLKKCAVIISKFLWKALAKCYCVSLLHWKSEPKAL